MTRSVEIAVAAIRGADPARFGDPSPCTEYTVGQVVSHRAFAAAGRDPRWSPTPA